MKSAPRSPAELADTLRAIFPALPRDFGHAGESVFVDAGPTYSSVLREFAWLFTRDLHAWPDRQLRRFAELVAQSTASGGELAQALEECLLPQLRQPQVRSRLGAFLDLAG